MTGTPASTSRPAPRWVRRLAEENGATATEYGIVLAFIVMVTMAAIILFGLEMQGWFDELTAHLKLLLGIP